MRTASIISVTIIAFILTIIIATPASAIIAPGDPNFHGCVIAADGGGLSDVDCDKVPDVYDNCPFVPNPDQVDVDHNGIGDACDLVIDQITLQPETPMQGRSLLVAVSVFNARAYPMRNLVVRVDAPTLGVTGDDQIPLIKPGERITKEIVVKVPECAPTRVTDFVAIVEYPFAPGQKEVFNAVAKAPVVPSGHCANGQADDKTVVNILEMQDVNPVSGAIYPFTIHNNQMESRAYVLSITNQDDWGTSEINPGTVIVVPAGGSRDGAIQVWARPGASGQKSMVFTVQAKDDAKQIMLLANIPKSASPGVTPTLQLLLGILGFLCIIVLAFLVVHFAHRKHKERKMAREARVEHAAHNAHTVHKKK